MLVLSSSHSRKISGFCLLSGLKPDIRYMIFPLSNCVLGCQSLTPGLQSYQNVICLSRYHQFILCCQPVFPMHHFWVQVKRYLHSTSSIATAPSTSSAEAIIHFVFRSLALYTLRRAGPQWWSTTVRRGDLQAIVTPIQPDPARWPFRCLHFYFFQIVVLNLPDTSSAENKSKKKKSSPRGHRIYNFSRPFLGHQYCIFSLCDLCPGVEKKTVKECMHFHYMT